MVRLDKTVNAYRIEFSWTRAESLQVKQGISDKCEIWVLAHATWKTMIKGV